MRITALALLFIAFNLNAMAQRASISGKVSDQQNLEIINDATISLLLQKDSSVFRATRTDDQGQFLITALPTGRYILVVSSIGYSKLSIPIAITSDMPKRNLGVLKIKKLPYMLQEVVITAQAPPVVLKKDTIEFNAGSYRTRDNAVVQELLSKLPGLQLDKDGTLKAMGERVEKILVDGKPFFGGDPQLVLKNLPASIVAKVQVMDKRSDQPSGLSGINTQKVINLTLKKDKKNGLFGKFAAGGGTNDIYAANLNLNRFKGDMQWSVFAGTANNGIGVSDGTNDAGAQPGISKIRSGGFNFSNSWNKKLQINGSYNFNNTDNNVKMLSNRQYLLKDTSYNYNQNNLSSTQSNDHHFFTNITYDIDTLNNISFAGMFNFNKGDNSNTSTYKSLSKLEQIINQGQNTHHTQSTKPNSNINFTYQRKFTKPGRVFTASLFASINSSNSTDRQLSENRFFDRHGILLIDTLQQLTKNNSKSNATSIFINYTEPLANKRFLEFSYAYSQGDNNSDKSTFDYNRNTHRYDDFNPALSDAFNNTSYSHDASVGLRTKRTNYDYMLGLGVQQNTIKSYSQTIDSLTQQHTFRFNPVAQFNYSFSRNEKLKLMYRGSTRPPSLTELQPVPDNTNPLYIQVGNPHLKPEYASYYSLNYNSFNPSSYNSFFVNINFNNVYRKIVNATTINPQGQQISQPVNVNGMYNLAGTLAFGLPLEDKQSNVNANTGASLNRNIGFINGEENVSNNLNLNQSFSLDYHYNEIFDCNVGALVGYNKVSYSVQNNMNTVFYNYNFNIDMNVNLTSRWLLGVYCAYRNNTGLTPGYDARALTLNAFISKTIFKNKAGVFKLQGYDLLKQNKNISRIISDNYIDDKSTNVLTRYFLFSFTYNLNKFTSSSNR